MSCPRRLLLLACLAAISAVAGAGEPADDLALLSDEMNDPATLSDWLRINVTEGWNADQLEAFEIGITSPGWMHMLPYTSTWFDNWRGVLAYKVVDGDFVVATRVRTFNRARDGAPGSQFSLAGIMVRAPRDITPETWTAGGENYVFLSHGAASSPGSYQFEVKTTLDSDSELQISSSQPGPIEIQTARIGDAVIVLRRGFGEEWAVHQRYHRPDFPSAGMQVGITCYTDWPNASAVDPLVHNGSVITEESNPDLIAELDYVRFRRPVVPMGLQGLDLTDPEAVDDADLLLFLGAVPAAPPAQIFSDGFEAGDTAAWSATVS